MKELRVNYFLASTPGHEIDGRNGGLEGLAIVRGWAGTRTQTSASQESCCTEPGSFLGRGRALGGSLLTLKNKAVFQLKWAVEGKGQWHESKT